MEMSFEFLNVLTLLTFGTVTLNGEGNIQFFVPSQKLKYLVTK